MKPDKFLCCRFFVLFFGLDRAQNTIVAEELTNRNVLITKFMHIV